MSEQFRFGDDEDEAPKKKVRPPRNIPLAGAAAVGLGLLGVGFVYLTSGDNQQPQPLTASRTEEFQSDTQTAGSSFFANLGLEAQEAEVEASAQSPFVPEAQPLGGADPLQAEVDRLRNELSARTGSNAELAEQLATLNQRLDGMQSEMEQARRDAERAQQQAVLRDAERQADMAAQQQLAAARQAAEETRGRQVASASVIFDNGSQTSTGPGASQDGPTGAVLYNPDGSQREPTIDERGRAFVERARPVEVGRSGIVANPSITMAQGTIVTATLDTAISSHLPGQIIATVNSPVESMDGRTILVPPGSRLFGEYQTAQSVGERRIQVAWSRILTPDGVSVDLQSFGADALGRSGVTGDVNSRWGTRFAAAALISFVGIGPALLADNARSDTQEDAINDMGRSLVTALAPTVSQYMNVPPIISVPQGTAVTVIVNRDVEVYR